MFYISAKLNEQNLEQELLLHMSTSTSSPIKEKLEQPLSHTSNKSREKKLVPPIDHHKTRQNGLGIEHIELI